MDRVRREKMRREAMLLAPPAEEPVADPPGPRHHGVAAPRKRSGAVGDEDVTAVDAQSRDAAPGRGVDDGLGPAGGEDDAFAHGPDRTRD